MDKHINNWLDEVEGKEPETSNEGIKKELKRQGYIKNNTIFKGTYKRINI